MLFSNNKKRKNKNYMQHRGCINGHRGVDNYVSRKKQHSRKTNIESNRKNIVSVIHVRHMNE